MKKIVFAIALACLNALAGSPNVWIQENVDFKTNNFHFSFSEENRIGVKDGMHFDELHFTPSISYDCFSWMTIGANYRYVLLRDGSDIRYSEDSRPGLDVTFKQTVQSWKVSNRSRFICRKFENEQAYFRYRNLTKVVSPWKITQYELNPYASYEWYFDEGSNDREYKKNDKFSIQWLTFGCNFTFTRSAKAALWYMFVENRDRMNHKWNIEYVIGITLNLDF